LSDTCPSHATVPHVTTTRAWTDDYSNIVQEMSFGRVN
jgi:hypothetical protein